jgi:hypothetical protein
MDLAGFEPAIFGLEVRRHIHAWLQVHNNYNYIYKFNFSFKFYYSPIRSHKMNEF